MNNVVVFALNQRAQRQVTWQVRKRVVSRSLIFIARWRRGEMVGVGHRGVIGPPKHGSRVTGAGIFWSWMLRGDIALVFVADGYIVFLTSPQSFLVDCEQSLKRC
jgi:hypothetical protein